MKSLELTLQPESAIPRTHIEPALSGPASAPPPPPLSDRKTIKRLRVWLALGTGLVIGSTGGWFWWQSQQLMPQAEPVPMKALASRKTPAAEASTPAAPPLPQRSHNAPATVASQPVIVRKHASAVVPPLSEEAWQAFRRSDFATAERLYRNALGADRNNRDALLGLAAITIRQDRKPEALAYYQRLLTLNPRDETAQAGLLMLQPEQLNEAAEAQFLQQGDAPDAPLILASFYAGQGRWHEAQEQYFRAYSRQPDNADLAFNLAVSLEQIRQPGLAAEYYRKALALDGGSFDRAAAEKRLAETTGETP